ncbi:MAG: hypothetical protein M3Z22_02150 [Verrucomicrobiota bacterium]|nr:hypothetical protein [Verrucomicrobiota bacterium]
MLPPLDRFMPERPAELDLLLFALPRLLLELAFFEPEDFAPERPPLLLADFFPREAFPPDDLLPEEDFPPFAREEDFELPPLFDGDEDLRLPELLLDLDLLADDFPEPMPTARLAAPAAWETVRFADWTFAGFVAALPARAPMTPPTTAPTGPATLPTTAPAAAPACALEIGGMSSFLDEDDSLPEC